MPLFQALTTRMRWLHERQGVIAANVANADTPDYRARELNKPDFAALLRRSSERMTAATTHSDHMSAGAGAPDFRDEAPKSGGFDVSPTGNSVVLEEEMLKIAETSAAYQLASGLYGKHIAMLKSVIGRGR